MPILPKDFVPNEAWLLFQLNDAPVRTSQDGDFNVLAILDVATGLILGMQFVQVQAPEPSELESRKLLAAAQSEAGATSRCLFVDADQEFRQVTAVAAKLGIDVVSKAAADLDPLTREAREGLAAHLAQGQRQ